MTRFPGPSHLVSWAGLCPRLDESAGKRRSTRIRHATPWLKTVLVQAAWAAARKNGGYLQSQFRRLKGRCGPKKAIVAVAASMLTAAYFMLRDEKDYHDLGGRYLSNHDKQRVTQRLLRRLQNLGVVVEVKAASASVQHRFLCSSPPGGAGPCGHRRVLRGGRRGGLRADRDGGDGQVAGLHRVGAKAHRRADRLR